LRLVFFFYYLDFVACYSSVELRHDHGNLIVRLRYQTKMQATIISVCTPMCYVALGPGLHGRLEEPCEEQRLTYGGCDPEELMRSLGSGGSGALDDLGGVITRI
jgi:hypothetical protein